MKIRSIVLCALASLLLHCAPESLPAESEPVLRSYKISTQDQLQIVVALNQIVSATPLSPGVIAVSAPEPMQQRVQEFIDEYSRLVARAESEKNSTSIFMEYWLVTASPGETVDWGSLRAVEEPLRALMDAKGEQRFKLHGSYSGLATVGTKSSISSNDITQISQTLRVLDDRVTGNVSVRREAPLQVSGRTQFRSSVIDTSVSLIPSRFYILATSTADSEDLADPTDLTDQTSLVYIVRANIIAQE